LLKIQKAEQQVLRKGIGELERQQQKKTHRSKKEGVSERGMVGIVGQSREAR